VRFALLGPVRAESSGQMSPKERTVLAALLLRANTVVSVTMLAQALWDDTPPPSARNTIQGHVKQLRKLLGPESERIITRAPGYLIEVRLGELDLHEFARLRDQAAATARDGAWEQASGLLTEALALWRGEPLSDVPSPYLRRAELPRLTEFQHEALEARIDADLHLGRHEKVTAELRGLVAEHPFRERFWEQLMLALYRAGRQSEALDAYTEARRRLSTELGIDPGPRLAELHGRILNADPELGLPAGRGGPDVAAREIPRQLPADLPDFTGRDDEFQRLRDALVTSAARRPGAVPVATVSGPGGIGKTALAVHVAHQLAERFPDGQLFVVLGGAANPLKATDVLGRLLRDLGVPDGKIPDSEGERTALYRTITADRTMLVVLDDAHSSAQVRPLLPGTGGSAVIVTSRTALTDLAGAAFSALRVFDTTESAELLRAIIGERRTDDDPAGTDAVVAACAGLPLALRIAASRLATRPGWTTGQLGALLASQQRRLGELSAGDTAVRTTFEVSYRGLTRPVGARIFRLFGLAGLTTISLPALAALAGCQEAEAAEAAETLLYAHLLESPEPGRYQAHDLLRLYAAERANTEETAPSRHQSLHRLLAWYLHTAHAAVSALGKQTEQFPPAPPPPGVTAGTFGDRAEALDWLRDEYPNLIEALSMALAQVLPDIGMRLAWVLQLYLEWSGQWTDKLAAMKVGLVAAEAAGDEQAIAALLGSVAGGYWMTGQYPMALDYRRRALAVRRKLGDKSGESTALTNLATTEIDAGLIDSGVAHLSEALVLSRESGNESTEGYVQHGLGHAYQLSGQLDKALEHFTEALAIRTRLDTLHEISGTSHSIAEVLLSLGRVNEAMELLEQVLEVSRENNMRYGEGMTLTTLGDSYIALGKSAEARAAWEQAYDILIEIGASEAENVLSRLARET
jgi:DNA-binding SARP family transcriptional activator/Flp pilus assembly protein TadD/Mrp family chromosome partitioning ATPase